MNFLSKITNKIKAKKKLKKSNWGRDYGWFIEFEGKKIGELVDAEFEDMFWYKYKIISYDGFEKILLNSKNWKESKFQFRNKHYNQYAKNAFSSPMLRKEKDKYVISMRGLYVKN